MLIGDGRSHLDCLAHAGACWRASTRGLRERSEIWTQDQRRVVSFAQLSLGFSLGKALGNPGLGARLGSMMASGTSELVTLWWKYAMATGLD